MKLHSLKFKQFVAKVLYLLASQLCTLANTVLDKLLDQVKNNLFDYDLQVSDEVFDLDRRKVIPLRELNLDLTDIGGDDNDS